MRRQQALFCGLIAAQAAHSVEEYVGRLYDSFPPARYVSGLVSSDLQRGFAVLTVALLLIASACVVVVLRDRPAARAVMVPWIVIELGNGVVHPAWSLIQRGYTPGVATAPLLLLLAALLARDLLREVDPA